MTAARLKHTPETAAEEIVAAVRSDEDVEYIVAGLMRATEDATAKRIAEWLRSQIRGPHGLTVSFLPEQIERGDWRHE